MSINTPLRDSTFGYEMIDGIWWNMDRCVPERIQDLISVDWPLHFNKEFVLECAMNPAYDSLGTFCMGWEL